MGLLAVETRRQTLVTNECMQGALLFQATRDRSKFAAKRAVARGANQLAMPR